MLDPKSGFIEFEIIAKPGTSMSSRKVFKPITQRFYQYDAFKKDVLQPGEGLSNNVNLTFGSAGFSFAEPGSYTIRGSFYFQKNQTYYTIQSEEVFIRVVAPTSWIEEKEALELMKPQVGLYWALGGSDILSEVQRSLSQVKVSRRKRLKGSPDGLLANIVRVESFSKNRCFVNYKDGGFSVRESKKDEARAILAELEDPRFSSCFDRVTKNQMFDV
jgi:hypothetical protein